MTLPTFELSKLESGVQLHTAMKAIMPNISESVLETRRSWGADRADEVWNGVLHMLPPPRKTHQQFEGALETWIRNHWVARGKGQDTEVSRDPVSALEIRTADERKRCLSFRDLSCLEEVVADERERDDISEHDERVLPNEAGIDVESVGHEVRIIEIPIVRQHAGDRPHE